MYLQRVDSRPTLANMRSADQEFLTRHFDAYGAELMINQHPIRWEHIDEVEVVIAPRAAGVAGWIVKTFFLNGETRYHLGIYFGSYEAVLPNITWDIARYVLQNVAYYASQPIRYKGPEDLVPLSEV